MRLSRSFGCVKTRVTCPTGQKTNFLQTQKLPKNLISQDKLLQKMTKVHTAC